MKKIAALSSMFMAAMSCAAAPAAYMSPEFVSAAPDGKSVYVTAATGARVLRVKIADGSMSEWKVVSAKAAKKAPTNPTGVAVAPDGAVYVTAGVQNGELQKFDSTGKLIAAASVGHSPRGPVVSADGKTVFVLNRFSNKISVVDAA